MEKESDKMIINANVWSERERKVQLEVIHQQKKLIADMMLETSRQTPLLKGFVVKGQELGLNVERKHLNQYFTKIIKLKI